MATKKKTDEIVKHTVHTDALETLGHKIDHTQGRDAIHLAVEPMIAGEPLLPGMHVGVVKQDGALVAFNVNPPHYDGAPIKHIGIVDPFLEEPVHAGERFWFIVYPRMISSLRHVWTHPSFPDLTQDLPSGPTEAQKIESMDWIKNYAEELSADAYEDDPEVSAEELIDHAKTWTDEHKTAWGGDHLVKGGLLEGVSTNPEFWEHFEVVTGLKAPSDKPNFFSCSC